MCLVLQGYHDSCNILVENSAVVNLLTTHIYLSDKLILYSLQSVPSSSSDSSKKVSTTFQREKNSYSYNLA